MSLPPYKQIYHSILDFENVILSLICLFRFLSSQTDGVCLQKRWDSFYVNGFFLFFYSILFVYWSIWFVALTAESNFGKSIYFLARTQYFHCTQLLRIFASYILNKMIRYVITPFDNSKNKSSQGIDRTSQYIIIIAFV